MGTYFGSKEVTLDEKLCVTYSQGREQKGSFPQEALARMLGKFLCQTYLYLCVVHRLLWLIYTLLWKRYEGSWTI